MCTVHPAPSPHPLIRARTCLRTPVFFFTCFGVLGVQLFMGRLSERCHVWDAQHGMILADGDTPCGGANDCVRAAAALRQGYAGSGGGSGSSWALAGAQMLGETNLPSVLPTSASLTSGRGRCADLSVSGGASLAHGALFCCVPTPPPADSFAFFNAATSLDRSSTNPSFGFSSFDNLLLAWLVLYRAFTVEGWAGTMQMLSLGFSQAWSVAFMLLFVFVAGWLSVRVCTTQRRELSANCGRAWAALRHTWRNHGRSTCSLPLPWLLA
jgi:hypothetical protein